MNHIITYVISTWNFEKNLSDSENTKIVNFGLGFYEGRVKCSIKKKNLEFSRFGLTHPPILVIAKNLEKIKKFYF